MDDELDYGSDNSMHDDIGDDSIDDEVPRQPKDRLDVIIDRKEKIATEKAFGINEEDEKHLCLGFSSEIGVSKRPGWGKKEKLNDMQKSHTLTKKRPQ
ncbi:hypothetical protein B9Z55_018989 [Caenorhabditis nigoni]|uniref:Uncharacterized protein n=1 Tax=Caenorhabditis nigoni TaxID=1611254 RepID=A0A2G5TGF2_9PELO|nr:hypothetical protein B9Z55_018989 [Caenorhabditis nigoni]